MYMYIYKNKITGHTIEAKNFITEFKGRLENYELIEITGETITQEEIKEQRKITKDIIKTKLKKNK